MTGRLAGKVALITGAGRGIGRAIAVKMAQESASVVIADIDSAAGQQTERELRDAGHQALFAQTDVTSEASVQAAIALAVQTFGKLHVLVNNAGLDLHYDASRMTVEEWEKAMAVNLRSAWLCSKYALPEMATSGGGAVINIASVHASQTMYNSFPYAVTKAGLLGMTRSLALDWGDKNIRVMAVSPGYVRTQRVIDDFNQTADPAAEEARVAKLHPIRRIGTPEDVGNLVAFLASDEAGFITGAEIIIDGGLTARFAD
jgi:NAD(P)-dependent dehydrogenase (short-subunit alcohol dehydrogenase family)